MEVSGVAFRSLSCFSGTGFDPLSSKRASVSALLTGDRIPYVDLRVQGSRDSIASMRSTKLSGFSDSGHFKYYVSPRSEGTKKEKKKKDPEMVPIKKKLKFIKVLSRDLSMLSSWGFGVEAEGGLIDEDKSKRISEAAGLLLEQLKRLREEEKEMKKKRKEEKARLKATQLIGTADVSNRSGSSEGENTETANSQRDGAVAEAKSISSSLLMQEQKKMLMGGTGLEGSIIHNYGQERCPRNCGSCSRGSNIGSSSGAVMEATEGRIEVCMGGKCKKGGAMALLEEFQKKVGTEVTVVGCKCMGKCRDGPNVRVLDLKTSQKNPLCIGVGLEDVGLIVANFTGEQRKELGLIAA